MLIRTDFGERRTSGSEGGEKRGQAALRNPQGITAHGEALGSRVFDVLWIALANGALLSFDCAVASLLTVEISCKQGDVSDREVQLLDTAKANPTDIEVQLQLLLL